MLSFHRRNAKKRQLQLSIYIHIEMVTMPKNITKFMGFVFLEKLNFKMNKRTFPPSISTSDFINVSLFYFIT